MWVAMLRSTVRVINMHVSLVLPLLREFEVLLNLTVFLCE